MSLREMQPAELQRPTDQYELLPFDSALTEAAAVAPSLNVTVTCSPRLGNDEAVDLAIKLRSLGHTPTPHIAARMVRSAGHLDELLSRMNAGNVRGVFLVGGDAAQPVGPYRRALDVLGELRAHPLAPRWIGIPGYPEGHPLISSDVLADDLRLKAPEADYIVSQMCFEPERITGWIDEIRTDGIVAPVRVGIPGVVNRRRLLEISMRIGVGSSLSFLRKNRGARQLGQAEVSGRMVREIRPLVGGELGIEGMHLYTFNRLVDTVRLVEEYSDNLTTNEPRRLAGPSSASPIEE